MREKTVKRYYCDHCSKGGFRKPDMVQHELTCTRNPKRACWLCESGAGGFDYLAIATEMKKRSDVTFVDSESHAGASEDCHCTSSKDAIKWLMEQVVQCPACALSVLRMGKIFAFDVFVYKDEVQNWHKERADEIRDLCGGNMGIT